MKPSEIRKKTEKDILKTVETLKQDVFKLQLQRRTGQLKNSAELRKNRRAVARYLTVLNEKRTAEKA